MSIAWSVVCCWLFLAAVLLLTGCSRFVAPIEPAHEPIRSGDSGPPELEEWDGPGPGQGVRRVDGR